MTLFGALGSIGAAEAADAFTLSDRLKLRARIRKHIFRQALAPLVPERFVDRKQAPQRMTYGVAFPRRRDAVADRVLSRTAVDDRGFFDYTELGRLRRAPDSPYADEVAMRIWTAILTEVWARRFLDERGARPAGIEG